MPRLVMPQATAVRGGSTGGRRERRVARFGEVAREASVLRIGGTYVTVEGPTTEQMESASEVWLGGHINEVSAEQASALQGAGYTVEG
jgi:hypothetical protein